MMISRRNFVAGLGLGSAGTLLAPLCRRLVGEALGQPSTARRLSLLVASNGWNYEGHDRSAPMVDNRPGENSVLFQAKVRAPDDFDLPPFMEPLGPYRGEAMVLFGLNNFEGTPEGFHGSASCGLTAAPKGQGASIDRVIGGELKAKYDDLYVGCNFASTISGSTACPSYDGSGRKADAYTTPVKAYAAYFGGATGMTPQQAQSTIELDRSLFDGMARDIERVRGRLAGAERAKLDQVLESTREVEKKLTVLQSSPKLNAEKPAAPSQGGDRGTYSDSWGQILPGIPADSHNGLMHKPEYDQIRRVAHYQATELAYLRGLLGGVREGSGTMADNSLCVWTNTSGLRHHRGSNCHVIVGLAGKNVPVRKPLWLSTSRLVSGKLYRIEGARHVGEAYTSIANAVGVPLTRFGAGAGPLPGIA